MTTTLVSEWMNSRTYRTALFQSGNWSTSQIHAVHNSNQSGSKFGPRHASPGDTTRTVALFSPLSPLGQSYPCNFKLAID